MIEAFRKAMQEAGIEPPSTIHDDGCFYKNGDSWYVLLSHDGDNSLYCGAFGNYKEKTIKYWHQNIQNTEDHQIAKAAVNLLFTDEGITFSADGQVNGLYYLLGKIDFSSTICICIDWKDSRVIHEATKNPVAVCFSQENLAKIGLSIRKQYPDIRLEAWVNNRSDAEEINSKAGAYIINSPIGYNDFVSLEQASGLEAIKNCRPDESKTPKASQAKKIIDLIKYDTELFHDGKQNAYATIRQRDKTFTLSIRSSKFEGYIRDRVADKYEYGFVRTPIMKECLEALNSIALHKGKKYDVFQRVGFYKNEIYYDLSTGKFVKITANGWEITNDSPIKFKTTNSMTEAPMPEKNGNIEDLWHFINIPAESRQLFLAWLLDCFRSYTPYPILVLTGSKGSAKSTTQEFLQQLIDPSNSPLRSAPKDNHDLTVAAFNNHVISLNNISHFTPSQQDLLCCISSGGSYSTRKLYTEMEEVSINYKNPIIINGINDPITAQDLIDRVIAIELPLVHTAQRETEGVLKEAFNNAKPKILGAIFDMLAKVLQELPNVQLTNKPRMADFAVLGVALEKAMGEKPDSFMSDYRANQDEARMSALEDCPAASALIDYLGSYSCPLFKGSYKDLLKVLNPHKPRYANEGWPKSPRKLSAMLKRQEGALELLGIKITEQSRNKFGSQVLIQRKEEDKGNDSDVSFLKKGLGLNKIIEKDLHHVHQPSRSSRPKDFFGERVEGLNTRFSAGLKREVEIAAPQSILTSDADKNGCV